MRKSILMAAIALLSGAAIYRYNIRISYSDIKNYCDALMILSGMIFTIMGIWIAFTYPNAIKKLSDPQTIEMADFSDTLHDTRRLESIIHSVMSSGFVAVSITILFFIKIILSPITQLVPYRDILTSAAFIVIVLLTLIQLSSVWSVLQANYLFIAELHHKREVQERKNDF